MLLFSLSFNLYFLTKKNNEVPYEQTYDYLFSRVESYSNHIIRTSYYGKDYFTIPVLTSCGVNDYVNIQQYCLDKSEGGETLANANPSEDLIRC